ncbi:MAG: hypothetical protein HUU08_04745 [Candidatus Brocadia sp.]|nr:hypothetical protein [Candidatus Brocadia sp.]
MSKLQDSPDKAQLTIDVSRNKKKINKYLYGINVANWCPWYYLNLCTPKLTDAHVSVIRLGATNMERYNFGNNRMFNVITQKNEYAPMSWKSFVEWCRDDAKAEPFLQASVYGHVAGEGVATDDPDYDHKQSEEEVEKWILQAGNSVKFWGIGNEPWIAWKRGDYPDPYGDDAHGDQVLNKDTSFDNYFSRFLSLAYKIKQANPNAVVFGPTSANWWLYWTNDYSPYCQVTEPNGDPKIDDPGWEIMADIENQWNRKVFPDRGDNPEITGWETDQNRVLSQYLIRAKEYEEEKGTRVADYMDVHRYIRATTEKDAMQETRGLWQEGFLSWDMETGSYGIETKVLKRFQDMVDRYYPATGLSFSEYDYFYWNGHPKLPQVAAIGQMDFLGFFARMGVRLACNWYVGEPNQAGNTGRKGADSANQAMFNEEGEPNPKYWAFWLMSHYFRGNTVSAESSDWEAFSVHASQRGKDIVVFAAYKGAYDQTTGDFISGQSAKTSQIIINGLDTQTKNRLKINKILRFGMDDPYIVQMETSGIDIANGSFNFEFQPLAIYAFIISKEGLQTMPETYLHISPKRIDFGPYETGAYEKNGENHYTVPIKITNARLGVTAWSVSKEAAWLNIAGEARGAAKVTDTVYVTADRRDLSYGNHETTVTVNTSEGTVKIPVTVEVVQKEAEGVKRICDFETGSLAHEWNEVEPYSVGWWDAHGIPEDRDSPYVYRFFLDKTVKPDMGGRASMRIEFNRANGDTKNGRLYLPFGTYGHKTITTGEDGEEVTYHATGDWSDYESFTFDIRTDTKDSKITKFLIVLSDESGNKGKPAVGIASYEDLMEIKDGKWQTITIPLESSFYFYDWHYPGGQNGSTVQLDFSHISQIEFTPWNGSKNKSGTIYLDNLRLIKNLSKGTSTLRMQD